MEYLAANEIAYKFLTKNANINSNENAKKTLDNYFETPLIDDVTFVTAFDVLRSSTPHKNPK